MSKAEILTQFVSQEMEIIKETGPDNEIVYRHPRGSIVDTYSLGFYDLMRSWLSKIQRIVDIMGQENYSDFGFIIEDVLRNMSQQLDEIFYLAENYIGSIKFDIVSYGDVVYKEGRLLSVRNEKEASAKVDDQTEAPSPDQNRSKN